MEQIPTAPQTLISWSRLFLKYLLICLSFISITYSTFLIVTFTKRYNDNIEAMKNNAKQSSRLAVKQIDNFINQLKPLVDTLVDKLNHTKMSAKEIENYLKTKPVGVFSFGVAFTPYQFDSQKKLYAPYYFDKGDQNSLVHIEDVYDYTAPEHSWFANSIDHAKTQKDFSVNYKDPISNNLVDTYSKPFYSPADPTKPIGVVFASQSVNYIDHVLSIIFEKKSLIGFWAIVAADGTFLSHPYQHLVDQSVNILDYAKANNNTKLFTVMQNLINNPPSDLIIEDYNNVITGSPSWVISNRMPSTGWLLHTIIPKEELPIDGPTTKKQLMYTAIHILISLSLITTFILFFILRTPLSIWVIPSIYSFILAVSIGAIWYIENSWPQYQSKMNIIKDEDQLYDFLDVKKPVADISDIKLSNEQLLKRILWQYNDKNHIPTGIYLNDITFKSSDDVEIVGYIWQRYSKKLHKELARGFILPQANIIRINEVHRHITDKYETIVWEVRATINQTLNYETYPFDEGTISIEIDHKDFDKNIILIPDFDSYHLIDPFALPGLNTLMNITDWRIISSSFGYLKKYYNTSFGSYDIGQFGPYNHINKSHRPEFYFNITIKRYLSNILITQLWPLFVLALFLFVALLTLSDFTVFAGYASLFFTAIFSHLSFNEKIKFDKIVYLESFFIILYCIIFLLTIFSLLTLFNPQFKSRFHNLANILYWPILLSMINITTIWYLY